MSRSPKTKAPLNFQVRPAEFTAVYCDKRTTDGKRCSKLLCELFNTNLGTVVVHSPRSDGVARERLESFILNNSSVWYDGWPDSNVYNVDLTGVENPRLYSHIIEGSRESCEEGARIYFRLAHRVMSPGVLTVCSCQSSKGADICSAMSIVEPARASRASDAAARRVSLSKVVDRASSVSPLQVLGLLSLAADSSADGSTILR